LSVLVLNICKKQQVQQQHLQQQKQQQQRQHQQRSPLLLVSTADHKGSKKFCTAAHCTQVQAAACAYADALNPMHSKLHVSSTDTRM
jgi:ATP:corrinoid adenosyltransferase